jgi:hypothetical protein
MWRQEMLPSILHGCHFDAVSSFSLKNFVLDIFLSELVRSELKIFNLTERIEKQEKKIGIDTLLKLQQIDFQKYY